MQFIYANGIPTVESAMRQAVGAFIAPGHNSVTHVLNGAIREVADDALREIRTILTGELTTLFDIEGAAMEWNEAVEKCIQVVEGTL